MANRGMSIITGGTHKGAVSRIFVEPADHRCSQCVGPFGLSNIPCKNAGKEKR
jgi:hypothetical protein